MGCWAAAVAGTCNFQINCNELDRIFDVSVSQLTLLRLVSDTLMVDDEVGLSSSVHFGLWSLIAVVLPRPAVDSLIKHKVMIRFQEYIEVKEIRIF
jgi:hypothetical protein